MYYICHHHHLFLCFLLLYLLFAFFCVELVYVQILCNSCQTLRLALWSNLLLLLRFCICIILKLWMCYCLHYIWWLFCSLVSISTVLFAYALYITMNYLTSSMLVTFGLLGKKWSDRVRIYRPSLNSNVRVWNLTTEFEF